MKKIILLACLYMLTGCASQLAEFNQSLAEINQSLDSSDTKTMKGKCLVSSADGSCSYREGMFNDK